MIQGRLVSAGDLTVDGDVMRGIFIECTKDELMSNKLMLYSGVEVHVSIKAEIAALLPIINRAWDESNANNFQACFEKLRQLSAV